MNRRGLTLPILIAVLANVQHARAYATDEQPINLLRTIDPVRHTLQGSWKCEGETLVSSQDGFCLLTIPYSPPKEYTITAVVQRKSGTKRFDFGLVVGPSPCVASIDALVDGESASGLNAIDGPTKGYKYLDNDTKLRGYFLVEGPPHTIQYTVRKVGGEKWGVTVTVDGKEIIDWEGGHSRLSLAPRNPIMKAGKEKFLWLESGDSTFAVSKLELTPIASDIAASKSPRERNGTAGRRTRQRNAPGTATTERRLSEVAKPVPPAQVAAEQSPSQLKAALEKQSVAKPPVTEQRGRPAGEAISPPSTEETKRPTHDSVTDVPPNVTSATAEGPPRAIPPEAKTRSGGTGKLVVGGFLLLGGVIGALAFWKSRQRQPAIEDESPPPLSHDSDDEPPPIPPD